MLSIDLPYVYKKGLNTIQFNLCLEDDLGDTDLSIVDAERSLYQFGNKNPVRLLPKQPSLYCWGIENKSLTGRAKSRCV
jgi:hypothetical protein